MVLVILWWWVSVYVMVDRSGGVVWSGGGGLWLLWCGGERERETEREAMRNPPRTQPVAIFTYDFLP